MTDRIIVADGHVHVHGCYDTEAFFDSAHANLERVARRAAGSERPALMLLLTECRGDDWFQRLHAEAAGRAGGAALPRGWTVQPTQEAESLRVTNGDREMTFVAGRQVACSEGLEVLLHGTTSSPEDGGPIRTVLASAAAAELPHVIPWGAGKWFGSRGRLLDDLLRSHRSPLFFLGDEGGRPVFWPYPRHFRSASEHGVRDLPGTDPLPFTRDVRKVGRMGFRVRCAFDPARPWASLRSALAAPGTRLERFATLERPLAFVLNQTAMQLRKHRPATN
jgi:hypothetical protein